MQTVSTHAALVVPAPGQMLIERVPTKRPQVGEILVSPYSPASVAPTWTRCVESDRLARASWAMKGWRELWRLVLKRPNIS